MVDVFFYPIIPRWTTKTIIKHNIILCGIYFIYIYIYNFFIINSWNIAFIKSGPQTKKMALQKINSTANSNAKAVCRTSFPRPPPCKLYMFVHSFFFFFFSFFFLNFFLRGYFLMFGLKECFDMIYIYMFCVLDYLLIFLFWKIKNTKTLTNKVACFYKHRKTTLYKFTNLIPECEFAYPNSQLTNKKKKKKKKES